MSTRFRDAGVLLAVCTLAACGAPADTAAPAPTTAPPSSSAAATTPADTTGEAETARCTAADLTLSLGEPTGEGQRVLPLVYTNSSDRACEIYGVPGVDLVGPDDPNGDTYSLPRPGADEEQARGTLQPDGNATAPLTYLTDAPGSVGTLGSTGWVPTEIVTTPPGDTEQLRAPWPSGDTVSRQDGATRPGTYVDALATP